MIFLYRKRPSIGALTIPSDVGDEMVTIPWSEVCLKIFAMWTFKDPATKITPSGEHLRVRAKAAIVTTPFYKLEDHDNYFYQQLILYKPWYDEEELLATGQEATNAFVQAYRGGSLKLPPSNLVDSRHTVQDLLDYVSTLKFLQLRDKSTPVPNLDDPGMEPENSVETGEGTSLPPSRGIEASLEKLSPQQKQMLRVVLKHDDLTGLGPLHLFFSGEGGTGKSFLLTALVHTLNQKHGIKPSDYDHSVVRVGALMGGAAFDVHGETLHRLFGFPVSSKKQKPYLTPMAPDVLKERRLQWRQVRYLIIDEISMVPVHMLLWVHLRLQAFKEKKELFGGVSVLAFGDLFQLQPPEGRYVFQDDIRFPTPLHLWREHFLCFSLTHNFRAEKDPAYIAFLQRARVGELVLADFKLLPFWFWR